ncbi:hypothetical protein [Salegentibacter salarius]|nr:hypothetical protein [Salegentibacter salarius]SLJ98363.1 hypothetical protein SAMN05660445_02097 [Salegentibacter salarius]
MKKVLLSIAILMFFSGCGLFNLRCNWFDLCYRVKNEQDASFPNNIKSSFDLSHYDIYVFNLCESYTNEDPDGNYELLQYPVFENCRVNISEKIIEQNILLLPRQLQNDTVLYITSFSHKNLYKDKGVFNCSEFKDTFFVEDTDFIFIGKKTKNHTLEFKDESGKIARWYYQKDANSLKVNLVSLPTSPSKPESPIKLSSAFSAQMIFYKEDFHLEYGKAAYPECFSGIKRPKPFKRAKNFKGEIEKIYLTDKHLLFMSKMNGFKEYYQFKNKRIRFNRSSQN